MQRAIFRIIASFQRHRFRNGEILLGNIDSYEGEVNVDVPKPEIVLIHTRDKGIRDFADRSHSVGAFAEGESLSLSKANLPPAAR
jgi:hypothetical protein